MQFFHEMSPKLELLDQQAEKIILESPYRDQLGEGRLWCICSEKYGDQSETFR